MSTPDKDLVKRARSMIAFLDGRNSLEGKWFGEPSPFGESPPFWWRERLSTIEQAIETLQRDNEALREALVVCFNQAKLFNRDTDAVWCAIRDQVDAALLKGGGV